MRGSQEVAGQPRGGGGRGEQSTSSTGQTRGGGFAEEWWALELGQAQDNGKGAGTGAGELRGRAAVLGPREPQRACVVLASHAPRGADPRPGDQEDGRPSARAHGGRSRAPGRARLSDALLKGARQGDWGGTGDVGRPPPRRHESTSPRLMTPAWRDYVRKTQIGGHSTWPSDGLSSQLSRS